MTRYVPSRSYLALAAISIALGVLSSWIALRWLPAAVPAGLFFATAVLNLFLALRPSIEIGNRTIVIGDKEFLWCEISRIERTGWVSPLVIRLVLKDGGRLTVIYPGALDGSRKLADELSRRLARSREMMPSPVLAASSVVRIPKDIDRYPVLNADDEAEVERLFARLKNVGHLESEEK